MREEISRLVKIGVHEEDYFSKWSSYYPSFSIPKKTEQSELLPVSAESTYCWSNSCNSFSIPKVVL
jgi:hypothetical protein